MVRPTGSTIRVGGVSYRLVLGDDGWTATRRTFPTIPIGPGDPGSGGPSDRTETDENKIEFGAAEFRLCDDCTTETADPREGEFLEVGEDTSNSGKAEYSLYELLGRSGIVSEERTFVEAAKEAIEEILQTVRNHIRLYELGGVDADEHIRGDGTTTGLWTQVVAELKVIFGSTFTREGPWGRDNEVDDDEIADVIEALEEIVDALSSLSAFDDEFSGWFAEGKTADDYFETPVARIKFGSTRNTRFGVYANKEEDATPTTGNWRSGAFAYSPLEQPDADDLPERGEATYRGDTVAVQPSQTDPTLYAGTIELTARFSTQRVDATITDLEDDDGDPWTHSTRDVESVILPVAVFDDNGSFALTGDTATVRYPAGVGTDATEGSSSFQGQFVNGGAEVFGTWTVGTLLEGAFGVGRTSTSSATRPRVSDRGSRIRGIPGQPQRCCARWRRRHHVRGLDVRRHHVQSDQPVWQQAGVGYR